MTLRLNGSTSGYVEIDAPAVAGTTSITFPATSGEAIVKAADGSVDLGSVDIDSSGRLLVGASSSSGIDSSLQVVSNTGVTIHRGVNSTSASLLILSKSRNTTYGSNTIVQNNDVIGLIGFRADDGTDYLTPAAQITAEVDGTPGANDMPGRLVFSTTADGASSPTERMRISQTGGIYMGRTTGGGRLNIEATWPSAPIDINVVSSNPTAAQLNFTFNSLGVGNIVSSSTATAYNTSSDYRLKENVVEISDAIQRVKQLAPKRFNFIIEPSITVDGFIAHEVQPVVPEAITGEKDAVDDEGNPVYQGIDQSKLVPLLTAALQEAVTKIEALETRLTALEGGTAQ